MSRVARPGSRGGDEAKNDEQRCKYADVLYGRFKAMYLSNPDVDLLICGDFNDDPTDESVRDYLHATGDVRAVRAAGPEPRLLALMAGKEGQP